MQYVWVADDDEVFFPARISKKKGAIYGLLKESGSYVEAPVDDCLEITDETVVKEICDDLVHLTEVNQVCELDKIH